MPLVYSSHPPTRPAWYWLREQCTKDVDDEIVRQIVEEGDNLIVIEDDFTYSTSSEDYKTTLWAGPIDKPMTISEYQQGGYIT